MFRAQIKVNLKTGVLDPQGEAIKDSLHSMNFNEVNDVKVGKLITLSLEDNDREQLEKRVEQMCERLLTNPVIENYQYELVEVMSK
ncbi:phosphoribosylformylglycinamidine synthase subunit PurS [Natranaerobius trueperi]|uniref:Phosphoribosylformylglycinamidine synthase subunit PurS n=1 Tax=Natranaerobius trueperi TaxID=759412 RepID=A0A226C0F8_9FIRM|nr:phosphoribosylformylglycinamidine synthase subunit PurS [Natranaerobius trueperi]OWZ84743.1 phosphoribosylformylglycinamidine synthase subunit PurS [Natranaerobius trueperi]